MKYEGQSLADRAVLVRLHISAPGFRRVDHKASGETNKRYKAQYGASRLEKQLLPKRALADISSVITKARGTHTHYTLPWEDDGARIIATGRYKDYAEKMSKLHVDFDNAVKQFVKVYPVLRESAPEMLGDLYKNEDYPPTNEIKGKFAFDIEVRNVQVASDFRAKITDDAAKAIVGDIERRTQARLERVMKENWESVYKVVDTLSTRLKNYSSDRGTLREEVIENIKEVANLLPDLNLTNDPEMDQMRTRLLDELCSQTTEELRRDDKSRAVTARKARDILKHVKDYL